MYLTEIVHDLDITLDVKKEEVLQTLKFKSSKYAFSLPRWRSKILFHSNQGRNVKLLWDQSFFSRLNNYTLVVENVIEFSWKQGSKTIYHKRLKSSTNQLVHYWILHTFLPLYYTLENIYQMLHVGAVEVNGKACLFAAPSFGGKSTLTHYFLQKSHKLFSDDKLALFKRNNTYYAVPSYPYSRNYRKLEDLGRYTKNFSTRSLPIGCIYRLVQVSPEAEISINQVKGSDKFSVIEISSDIKLPMLKQNMFLQLHSMAQNMKIYEIKVPQDINRLEEVYDRISEHFNMIED